MDEQEAWQYGMLAQGVASLGFGGYELVNGIRGLRAPPSEFGPNGYRLESQLISESPTAYGVPPGQSLMLRPIEIDFPASGLTAEQQQLFSAHLAEQELALNRISLTRPGDLELNLRNFENVDRQVDASRRLARQYLPGSGQGLDAAHALDSVAGGYIHEFVGFRDPIQRQIGALWRTRRYEIVPGQEHRLVPVFDQ